MADTNHSSVAPVQKVVVVDGSAEVLGMLEAVLDAGRYDMVFVESSNHAYSQIRKIVPNLVILCAGMEQAGGFQLLTMLKLDAETREIPVLTYTVPEEGSETDGVSPPADDDEDLVVVRPALSMN
jgi:two-component system phosphate regulon response regulator PhoB